MDRPGQEAWKLMRRVVPLIVAVISLAPACGCGGLGWYQAIGHLPGIARTEYAYYDFCGTSSQLYYFPPYEVEGALIEALGDLGYKLLEPPIRQPDGVALIHTHTPDGRPADITITPQNAMTNVRVQIGPIHIGDEAMSHELLRRIALNFGTVMRAYTPVDATLPRRFNHPRGIPPRFLGQPPETLQGEGLRPGENRDKPIDEVTEPDPDNPQQNSLQDAMDRFVPTRDFPNPPNMPYSPFPYTPF
jgi:hypothetical protein